MTQLSRLRIGVLAFGAMALAVRAALPRAEQTPSPAGTGLILGTVVDADTRDPIGSATVTLSGGPRPLRVGTDAEGRFVFRNLAKGRYTLTTTTGANGFSVNGFLVSGSGSPIAPYVNGGYGARRPNGPLETLDLGDGQKLGDVVIRIWKCGEIDGHVIDENGDPLVGVIVAAVAQAADGRLINGPTTTTDDRGVYHFGSLAPGRYAIVVPQVELAAPISAFDPDPAVRGPVPFTPSVLNPEPAVGVRVGASVIATNFSTNVTATNSLAPVAKNGRTLVYQTTFHPSATSANRAASVTVRSGESHEGVDVQLFPVPAASVSGTLVDSNGLVPSFTLDLFPADTGDGTSVMPVASTRTDGRGAFIFPLVPAGQYTIAALKVPPPAPSGAFERATAAPAPLEPSLWAALGVGVGDRDVPGLVVTLRTGVRVSGHVEFHGSAPPPSPDELTRPITWSYADRPSRNSPATVQTRLAADQFVLPSVAPGRYFLRAPDIGPWSVQSIMLDGVDITDAALTVAGKDLNDIVIVYSDQQTALTGMVHDANGADDAAADVCLFPTDRPRWNDARSTPRAAQSVRVSKNGTFTIGHLVAGDYFIVAIADEQAGDWPDPAFLAKLAEMATTIHVTSGPQTPLALTTKVLR